MNPASRRRLGAGAGWALLLAASACAWGPRSRPVREGEAVELQTAVVRVPAGQDWRASRRVDPPWQDLELSSRGGDRQLGVREHLDPVALDTRETEAALRSAAEAWFRGPAVVEEVALEAPARFGPSAKIVGFRVVERGAGSAGAGGRAAYHAGVAVTPPGPPGRTTVVQYAERDAEDPGVERFAERWKALLDGVEVRPATDANLRAAARSGRFPKSFVPGLAGRSLTLPAAGFQLGVERTRSLAPGGFLGGAGIAVGLSDRLELDSPGYLRLSFGEPEALSGPEIAVGAGVAGWDHDAARGSVWNLAGSVEARRRVTPELAIQAAVFGGGEHESRTGRTRPLGSAVVGVVRNLGFFFLSAGIEAGGRWADRAGDDRRRLWIGGLRTPVVTLHLPFLDVGLLGAAAWDANRGAGVIVGGSLLLTL